MESPGIGNMSCYFDILSLLLHTSKAFRCMLPMFREGRMINNRTSSVTTVAAQCS